jgi:putative membrane protein
VIPAPGDGWSRLSPRKLLLDPVKVLRQALVPVVVGLIGVSQSDNRFWPFLLPVAVIGPVVLGAIPWLTTHYRLTDTQIQVRRGLLNKSTSTAPLERVRSVDLEASLLHRILGLEKVQIGTGVDDDRIELDALAVADAAALRTTLLRRRSTAEALPVTDPLVTDPLVTDPSVAAQPAPAPDPAPEVLARIDWSWLRFAPFSLARLVLVAGAVGVVSQFADDLPIWNEGTATSVWAWVRQFALVAVVTVVLVVGLAGWVLVAVTGYVVQWWNFRLVREHGSLHLTTGLFTTRSITVEEAKVRGVQLTEPALLRVVGGAGLSTLATGVEHGVTEVLPPCPRDVAVSVGEAVLVGSGPLVDPLVEHGPLARRRAWFRQVRASLVLAVAAGVAVWWFEEPWWWAATIAVAALAFAALVGESSYRHLGHALADDHLVAGSGTLARIRTVLETDGIIGWVVAQSWWQRRIGLADLIATTAAGAESVLVRDVRLDVAVALADRATPGLLTAFVTAPVEPAQDRSQSQV